MEASLFNSFLMGMIVGGVIRIYNNNINKKRHVIDKNKTRTFTKLNMKNVPIKDVKAKYSSSVEYFNNTIKEKLPYVSLTNFNRNINDLIINEKKLSDKVTGQYHTGYNMINLLPNDEEGSLSHELLHLSSAVLNEKIIFSGFSQRSDDFCIGIGINEGYTSLLDGRYFKDSSTSYKLLQNIALLIEKIIGQKKMTKMYFEADLYGLIEELSKYCYKDTAYELIKNIDILYEYIYLMNFNEYSEEVITKLNEISKRITEVLLSCYINHLKFLLKEGLIISDEFYQLLTKFINDLFFSWELGNFTIEFLTPELLEHEMKFHFPKEKYNLHYEIEEKKKNK